MAYLVKDYLSDLVLEQGEHVEMALVAEEQEIDTIGLQRHRTSSFYDISFMLTLGKDVQEQKHNFFPLAKVLKSSRRGIAYGNKAEELNEVSRVVRELGFSRGAVLENFFKIPQLGLEQAMSSDSILYVYRGMVEYAYVVAQKCSASFQERLRLGEKEVTLQNLSVLYGSVKTVPFFGYKDRIVDDSSLLQRN